MLTVALDFFHPAWSFHVVHSELHLVHAHDVAADRRHELSFLELLRRVELCEDLLHYMRLDLDVEAWKVHDIPVLPGERVIDESLPGQEPPEGLAHMHLTRYTVHLNQARDEHILTKDVVAGDFRPNDAANNFSCIHTDFDVKLTETGVLDPLSLLLHYLSHLDSHLKEIKRLLNGIVNVPSIFIYLA